MTTIAEAWQYAQSLRSPGKRRYARAYVGWIETGARGDAPLPPAELSYMGAQAVRLALAPVVAAIRQEPA